VYCTQILCTVHNILYSTHQCVLVVYNSFCVLSTHSCTQQYTNLCTVHNFCVLYTQFLGQCTQQYTNLCTVHNFCVLYTQFLGQYTTSSVLQYTKLVCSTEVPGGNPSRPHRLAPIPSNHRDPNQKDFTWLVAFSYNNLRKASTASDCGYSAPKSETQVRKTRNISHGWLHSVTT
jgi:hypothetical protein